MRGFTVAVRSALVLTLVFALLLSFPGTAALAAPASAESAPARQSPDELGAGDTPVGVQSFAPATLQLAGSTRIDTAVAVSKFGWTSAKSVVIATARQFPDALVGGPLAFLLDAPILLTEPGALPATVAQEIRRLGASSAVVLGGTAAVSDEVIGQLEALGIARGAIVRIGGTDRYDTARRVAEYMGPSDRVVLAVGTNFPDALAVSALAGRIRMPILLTSTGSLPAATATAIDSIGPSETLVVGGVVAISEAVAAQMPNPTRVAGADRFETATLISEYACRYGLGFGATFVATGLDFPDALAVGPLNAKLGGSLVLATPTQLPPATEEFFINHCSSVETIHYVGGLAAVGLAVRTKIATAAETLISEAVVMADAPTLSALETITPDGTMVFGSSTGQLAGLSPQTERIIFIGEGGHPGAPDGFLREVLTKGSSAGKVTLTTKDVPLEEAIAKGSIDYHEPAEEIEIQHATIDVRSGELVSSEAPVSAQLKIGFDKTWSLTRDWWVENGGLKGGLTTEGSLTLRGGVYMNVSFSWFSVHTFSTGVYGEESIGLSIAAWGEIQKELEKSLFEQKIKDVTFWIGPVPVFIRFSVEAYVGVEGHGKLALETGFSQVASINYGTRYHSHASGNGWSKIDERVFEWGWNEPTVYGSFGSSAYAGIRLHARLYGCMGPYVAAEAGLYFEAEMPVYGFGAVASESASTVEPAPVRPALTDEVAAESLTECSWELGVYSELKTGIELKFPILRVGCEYTIPLGRWVLADYAGPPPPPPGERPVLDSVTCLSPTTVRLRFTSYNDTISAVDLARIRIWNGDSVAPQTLPVSGSEISGSDVILTTAQQTLDTYWLECQEGAVVDQFLRTNTVIQRPFAVPRFVALRPVAGDGSEPDISGSDGVSRWVVWSRWEEHLDPYGWSADLYVYDLESGVETRLTTDGATDLAVNVSPRLSGDTLVWEKRTGADTDVWAVDLTDGDPWMVEAAAGSPQVDGDWVVYVANSGALVAERLSTGAQVTAAASFSADHEWALADGRVALLRRDYWDLPATLEVRDLENAAVRTIVTEPQYLSGLRIDGDLIVCVRGQSGYDPVEAVFFDLAETSPQAHVVPLDGDRWSASVDVWGSTIVCFSGGELWIGDAFAQPERWILLSPPAGYELYGDALLALYGNDMLCLLLHEDSVGLYVLTP
jgi:putative cell wall-binding protein